MSKGSAGRLITLSIAIACIATLALELAVGRQMPLLYLVPALSGVIASRSSQIFRFPVLASACLLLGSFALPSPRWFDVAVVTATLWMIAMWCVIRDRRLRAHWLRRRRMLSRRTLAARQGQLASAAEAQRHLEQQMREKEVLLERLRIGAESAGISVWEWDVKARRLVSEQNIAGLLENESLASLDMQSRDFVQEAVHPDDRAACYAVLERTRTENDVSCRFRHLRADGEIAHMHFSIRVMRDESGAPQRLIGVTRDVTEEVQAAARLAREAEAQRVLIDRLNIAATTAGIVIWDRDLTTDQMEGEEALRRLFGTSNLPHLTSKDVIHPDDFEAMTAEIQRSLTDPSAPCVIASRVRVALPAGGIRHLQLHRRVFRDPSGKATRLLSAAWDVSAEVEAANRLREQAEHANLITERFNRATRAAGISSWEFDLTARRYMWDDNRPMGFGIDEVPLHELDTAYRALLTPEDEARCDRLIRNVIGKGIDQYSHRVRLRTPTGASRFLQSYGQIIRNEAGAPTHIVGASWDVTAMVEASNELLSATERAQAANQAKSAFLANVSHEIRTPMNGIIGMGGLLLDTTLDATQRDYAETIQGSARALLTVINDLLDFSKIEAGKLDIDSVQMELRTNVEDVATTLGLQAAAKNVELIINVDSDVPDVVQGDPLRIRQCLLNLVGNAVKFTRVGEVEIQVTRAGERNGVPMIRFAVRDTGIGIDQQTLDSLFQPFVQADASTTRDFGGTGLGLSIVRRLIEMMSGRVGVESTLGVGSRFWFDLPLPPSESQPSPAYAEQRGKRVLVVDDNATQRAVLQRQLTNAGYDVTTSADGVAALTELRAATATRRPFSAVLVDHAMPGMDGATLCGQLSDDATLPAVPMLLFTSLARPADERRFVAMGNLRALSKPLRVGEVLRSLNRALVDTASAGALPIREARVVPPEANTKRTFAGHVLLVEDNAVNQKVAKRFLERFGCTVQIAHHGAEAIDAFSTSSFDLVLMDLQMPIMDGFTATRHIRDAEAHRKHTPIVALTANAMVGQHERCLAVGMDGFLTKPLDVDRLRETLARFLNEHASATCVSSDADEFSTVLETESAQLVDVVRLAAVTNGDQAFAQELVEAFDQTCDAVVTELQTARRTMDRAQLERSAHRLKGAAANMHAQVLRLHAEELETCAAQLDELQLDIYLVQMRLYIERTLERLQAACLTPAGEGSLRSA